VPPLAAAAGKTQAAAKAKKKKAPPQVFYRWTDESGVVHVAQNPPAAGTSYSTIRALDD
jgi:hypothetical protein